MKITVDFNKTIGKIKPMHGVGQPPFEGTDFGMFKYLAEAGIPYSRLHDVAGAYGGNRWVDIPNIFRNFEKDPSDPASYDFTFTDLLVTALVKSGVEPFFRLGVTIENDAAIKSYRIDPPSDPYKWAVVCEHIIRHYTEGWANGFKYDIKYWEIWNEPDNYEEPCENQMWRGTKEQYYELYGIASKHLKKCFPHLKIGGYGSCGFYALKKTFVESAKSSPRYEYFIEFFDGFIDYVKANNCPLDFFSWHSYGDIECNRVYADYAGKRIAEAGFADIEISCNEWNSEVKSRGTARHAAVTCGMMLMFQNAPLDSAMFYDARLGVSVYGSMFNPLTKEPFKTYYAFKAFNELYKLGEQVKLECDTERVYAVAAKKDGKACVVVANPYLSELPIEIISGGKIIKCVITDEDNTEEVTALPDVLPHNSFLTVFLETE